MQKIAFSCGALLALVFVGAGCDLYPQANVEIEGNLEGEVQENAQPESEVDAEVNALIKISDEETREQKNEDETANRADDDAVEINTYSQGEYEIK